MTSFSTNLRNFLDSTAEANNAQSGAMVCSVMPRLCPLKRNELRSVDPVLFRVDPTLRAYTKVIDREATLTKNETEACEMILKALPESIDIMPLSLIFYKANFRAWQTRTLSVQYNKYASIIAPKDMSYQGSLIVNPYKYWTPSSPLRLTVSMPEGVLFGISTPFRIAWKKGTSRSEWPQGYSKRELFDYYYTRQDTYYGFIRYPHSDRNGYITRIDEPEGWVSMGMDRRDWKEIISLTAKDFRKY